MTKSCQCNICQNACRHRPGWFKHGEAEKAATYFGLTFKEFFAQYLAVDWWESDQETFLLAPAIIGEEAGQEYPGDPRGTCIFFENGLCKIHAVKPFECRKSMHDSDKDTSDKTRATIVESWRTHQDNIVELLGRKPCSEEFDAWGGLLGLW